MYLIDDGVWNDNIECDFTGDSLIEINFPPHGMPSIFLLVDIIQGVMLIDTLQKLNISSNIYSISDDGAVVLSKCLKTNTTLTELDLSWNHFTDEGISKISEALKVNKTLQKLKISDIYRISNDGVIAFSECLKTNTTLIELDLSCNNITHKGASVIAETLKVNNTLKN